MDKLKTLNTTDLSPAIADTYTISFCSASRLTVKARNELTPVLYHRAHKQILKMNGRNLSGRGSPLEEMINSLADYIGWVSMRPKK
jgi:hypothetical protein